MEGDIAFMLWVGRQEVIVPVFLSGERGEQLLDGCPCG
jgi:hypothetical protein